MNILEVIVLVVSLVGGIVLYQAHKNHATFKAQADADIAALKADVQTLKTKLAVHEATATSGALTVSGSAIAGGASTTNA